MTVVPLRFHLLVVLLVLTIQAGCGSRAEGGDPTPDSMSTATPAADSDSFDPSRLSLELELVLSGLSDPLFVTHAGDGSGRLFVVEQGGVIRVAEDGELLDEPFLDITQLVTAEGNEQGLLGLVFHADYERNGLFYVYYTAVADGANTLARYHAEPSGSQADPDGAAILLAIEDPKSNHNGGMLAFGPDGYLYIGTGDGGFGQSDNGQRRDVLLGKLLRIDVNGGDPYAIPPDNPFVEVEGARPEIWAYGLRNPWRFSFDRATDDLYIADVGSVYFEEINFQPAESEGGENYGWDIMEGMHCNPPDSSCDQQGLVLPVAEYERDRGCAVVGGYVYRGSEYPPLAGGYFYADYCEGIIWSLHRDAAGHWVSTELLDADFSISSFGEDEAGELYLTAMDEGVVYRVVAE